MIQSLDTDSFAHNIQLCLFSVHVIMLFDSLILIIFTIEGNNAKQPLSTNTKMVTLLLVF